MKFFSALLPLFTVLFFLVMGLKPVYIMAAPLAGGFALAPGAAASPEERANAYLQARQRVIDAAAKYLGTPYVWGGLTARGLDCSGLIVLSFRDALGVTIPRQAAALYTWSERIPYERAQPGDLLFFRTGNTRRITHVALYLGSGRFIHSASAGARTGVIFSSLSEAYWAGTFAGVGRALPEGTITPTNVSTNRQDNNQNVTTNQNPGSGSNANITTSSDNRIVLFGFAFAPSWDLFFVNRNVFRGFSSHLGLHWQLGSNFGLGAELRPELDRMLNVFRLPLTVSFGIGNSLTIFAGPVLSIGSPSIGVGDNQRRYYGGTSWFGTAGITYTPRAFQTPLGEFSPYVETAWRSYSSRSSDFLFFSDASASVLVSTGIRWRVEVSN